MNTSPPQSYVPPSRVKIAAPSLVGSLLILFLLLAPSRSALAFEPDIHVDITKKALGDVTAHVNNKDLKFTEAATGEVETANRGTDALLFPGDPFWEPTNHFDNEAFAASSARLVDLKNKIIEDLKLDPPNGAAARQKLGTALHTLQDFYAHSNWVETSDDINYDLGSKTMSNPGGTAFCPNDINVIEAPGLTSGYFDLTWLSAVEAIGGVITRNPVPPILTVLAVCTPPTGKCTHGFAPLGIEFCSGIAKDHQGEGKPAWEAAKAGAIDFVNQILKDGAIDGNEKRIRALLGLGGTLAMVIDDTGSMGGVLESVKSQVTAIVNEVSSPTYSGEKPGEYLLVRFGDPDVGSPFVTTDPNAFLDAVNSLSASGGGDCPEYSNSGLRRAVEASQENSTVYLFTDADSKDPEQAGAASAAAQAKRIKVIYALNGTCSAEFAAAHTDQASAQQDSATSKPEVTVAAIQADGEPDPSYVRIARETGGQLFMLDTSEIDSIFDLIRPQLFGKSSTLMLSSGVIGDTSQEFLIPVDSSIQGFVISISKEADSTDIQGDLDIFRITGAVGDVITATVAAESLGSFLDSVLTLYDSDGETVLAENDDFNGFDSQIEFVLPHPGPFFLTLRDYGGADGPDYFYSLGLAGNSTPPGALKPEIEPNDAPGTAMSIAYGDTISGTIAVIRPLGATLVRPSGAVVSDSEADAVIHNLQNGYIFTVNAPETGLWKLTLADKGEFSVVVNAQSELRFLDSEFVEYRIARHPGLYSILQDHPTAGNPATHRSSLTGPYQTAQFKLLSLSGALIQTVNLSADHAEAAQNEFIGDFSLPTQPFRIAVSGLNQDGSAYERVFPTLFEAQPVELALSPLVMGFVPGVTTPISLTIENKGSAATFELLATDNLGAVEPINPPTITLASGVSVTIDLAITVSPSTPLTGVLALAVTATDIDDATIHNSIAWNYPVGDFTPPIQINPTERIRVTIPEGGAASGPQTLSIQTKTSNQAWTAESAAGWLTLQPASGTGPTVMSASINASALASGIYTGVIQISSEGVIATRAVILTVEGEPNSSPNAVNDSVTTEQDKPITINVLANDSDVNNDTLTVTSVTTPTLGAATTNGTTITYTPTAGLRGTDTFSYVVADGRGGSATATVTVVIEAASDKVFLPSSMK
ncbi:MAG: cadherin-like domain-containing protein [Caldilineaceae bacterium]|nr:cadherin-like domain-containing protein [Caldilineaceae bacterium]